MYLAIAAENQPIYLGKSLSLVLSVTHVRVITITLRIAFGAVQTLAGCPDT